MTNRPTLDLYGYVPFYIRSIANRLTQIDKRLYSEEFGVGLNEWACLALLAREDGISASRICEVSGYDKAVISRSIRALLEKGMVSARSVKHHNRKQLLSLTESGQVAYQNIERRVLERERILLNCLAPEEKRSLLSMLERMLDTAGDLLGARAAKDNDNG